MCPKDTYNGYIRKSQVPCVSPEWCRKPRVILLLDLPFGLQQEAVRLDVGCLLAVSAATCRAAGACSGICLKIPLHCDFPPFTKNPAPGST